MRKNTAEELVNFARENVSQIYPKDGDYLWPELAASLPDGTDIYVRSQAFQDWLIAGWRAKTGRAPRRAHVADAIRTLVQS